MVRNIVINGKRQDVDIVIRNSSVLVMPGRFAMVKVQETGEKAKYFFLCNDGEEITMVVEEAQLSDIKYKEIQKWFKLIRLAVSVPFFSVGFLAKVSAAIADRDINILIISTYSNDYLLIRENDVGRTIEALNTLGFRTK